MDEELRRRINQLLDSMPCQVDWDRASDRSRVVAVVAAAIPSAPQGSQQPDNICRNFLKTIQAMGPLIDPSETGWLLNLQWLQSQIPR